MRSHRSVPRLYLSVLQLPLSPRRSLPPTFPLLPVLSRSPKLQNGRFRRIPRVSRVSIHRDDGRWRGPPSRRNVCNDLRRCTRWETNAQSDAWEIGFVIEIVTATYRQQLLSLVGLSGDYLYTFIGFPPFAERRNLATQREICDRHARPFVLFRRSFSSETFQPEDPAILSVSFQHRTTMDV